MLHRWSWQFPDAETATEAQRRWGTCGPLSMPWCLQRAMWRAAALTVGRVVVAVPMVRGWTWLIHRSSSSAVTTSGPLPAVNRHAP